MRPYFILPDTCDASPFILICQSEPQLMNTNVVMATGMALSRGEQSVYHQYFWEAVKHACCEGLWVYISARRPYLTRWP